MDKFTPIDYSTWDRAEIYERFSPCRYYITTKIDITSFIKTIKGIVKFYPTINYCIAKVINSHEEFRYAKINGKIGFFDIAHPLYTVMRKNSNHLFTHKFTIYDDDFNVFYNRFLKDKAMAEEGSKLYFDENLPENLVCTSIMPNISMDSLSFCYTSEEGGSYIPFIIVGKFFEENGKILLPVTGEFHHEINDGFHAQLFFEELEKTCREFTF